MAIDADYKTALEDLIKVQRQLQNDGIDAALEKSKRGGHLWIFFETPVLARDARIYIYHVAGKLAVQVKGASLADGIEIFPKQDQVRQEEFGNAIRAPLGVHWASASRAGAIGNKAPTTSYDQLPDLQAKESDEQHLQARSLERGSTGVRSAGAANRTFRGTSNPGR